MEQLDLHRKWVRRDEQTFSTHDWEILARHWHPVARLDDLGEQPHPVRLLDVRLVVYRASGVIAVAHDQCPHRGVPLSKGRVQHGALVCAYHGLQFEAGGRCRHIPAQPGLKPSERFRLDSFPCVERHGLLWTRLLPGTSEVPPMPTWDDDAHQSVLPPPVDIHGSATRQLEGFIDVAHFAFVHAEAFADPDNPVVPDYQTELTEFGLRGEYLSTVSNFPKPYQHLAPDGFVWRRSYEVHPPFTARLTVHFPAGGLLNILNAASPVSARHTRLFVPITRNFDTTGPVEEVYAFNSQVFAEDQDIVESQWPQDLPLDPMAEAHFAADRSSVTYRRLLRGMGLRFGEAPPTAPADATAG